jgi:hypothetical protein
MTPSNSCSPRLAVKFPSAALPQYQRRAIALFLYNIKGTPNFFPLNTEFLAIFNFFDPLRQESHAFLLTRQAINFISTPWF